ncbi:MAG TPA: hypothetical protein VG815_09435 [Chloroflexota bacterium]|jgi:hypothetical protein|nr:hypothetical protein [Chloroflexota bacterium]
MKRNLTIGAAAVVAALLILQASTFAKRTRQAHHGVSGPITIQSWLYAKPDKNGLSGIVTACFKLKGAFHDQGGSPNWTDSTYADTTGTPPANKCGNWYPTGGFVFVPGVKTSDTTVYAVHTITGRHGALFITFSGTYDLVNTYQTTSCDWVITGGTGQFAGAHGEGTCSADASHFPYIRHTETGYLSTK